MTDLSVIIVSYKGWDKLIKCLSALNGFTGDKFKFEVIVVDNNSEDDNIFKIEKQFPSFKFIRNAVNGGYANGINLGCKAAQGEFLLILNPDTIASEPAIEKLLITARSNPDYSIISCRQLNEAGRETKPYGEFPSLFKLTGFQRFISSLIGGQTDNKLSGEPVIFPDWVSGSVILIRKELFEQINGFYEGFWMYFEDVDLCKRVCDSGGKIALLRDVTIEHSHGGSSRINLRTKSITKSEVKASQHVYISRNLRGIERVFGQIFLVANNLISGLLMAVIGIVLFFIPGIFVNTLIFCRLVKYYTDSLVNKTWISSRSVLNKSFSN